MTQIDVTDDPVAVGAALASGPRWLAPLDRLLERRWVHRDDPLVRRAFAEDEQAATQRFTRVAAEPGESPDLRTSAARLLAYRGVTLDPLASLLVDPDPKLRQAALHDLDGLVSYPAIQRGARAALRDPEPQARQTALWLAARAGWDGLPEDSITFLRERLLAPPGDYAAAWTLGAFLPQGTAISRQAREALRACIETGQDRRHWLTAVTTLAGTPDRSDLDFLRTLVADGSHPTAVSACLVAIARLLRIDSLPLILARRTDARTAVGVVEALGIAAEGSGDAKVVQEVERATGSGHPQEPRWRLDAFLRIAGAAGRKAAVRYLVTVRDFRRAYFDAMDAVWALRGREVGAALSRLRSLGIIDREPPLGPRDTDPLRLFTATFRLLTGTGRVAVFDAEASRVPCQHDEILPHFADASLDCFEPDAAREEFSEPDRYRLTFVSGGRLYTTRFENENDYYNCAAVEAVVNRALADSAAPQRFVQLATPDQMAAYLFAVPEAVAQAAGELLILPSDEGAPIQRAIDELAAEWL